MSQQQPKLRTTFERRYVFVGTTAAKARVFVSVELYKQPSPDRVDQTVTHGKITDAENLSVGVVAFTGKKNISRNLADGLHDESFIRKVWTPAPGFTLAEVQELYSLVKKWKSNALHPGCAHMDLPEDTSYDARKHITCPETGYRYGHAHLVDPLPDDVRARVIELISQGNTEEVDY